MTTSINRRRFERFTLPVGYTEVSVRHAGIDEPLRVGHAYDISEGGIRFELDEPIEPGHAIELELKLPGPIGVGDEERTVHARARVIWLETEDLPGPVRMAAVFRSFNRPADREILMQRLIAGDYARAA